MTALLGLLAVAGFQNRDKLAEMLGGGTSNNLGASGHQGYGQQGDGQQSGGLGGLLGGGASSSSGSAGCGQQQGGLGGLLGGLGSGGLGGLLGGGLGELVENFKQKGHGEVADSWVGPGPNRQIAPHQLEEAIGPDVLETLSQQTGLSREDLLSRLSTTLPDAVDKYTPEGRLPSQSEFSRF
jgi:uncharacterized protein YidB (DUF937 family)